MQVTYNTDANPIGILEMNLVLKLRVDLHVGRPKHHSFVNAGLTNDTDQYMLPVDIIFFLRFIMLTHTTWLSKRPRLEQLLPMEARFTCNLAPQECPNPSGFKECHLQCQINSMSVQMHGWKRSR